MLHQGDQHHHHHNHYAEGDNKTTAANWTYPEAQAIVRLTQKVFKSWSLSMVMMILLILLLFIVIYIYHIIIQAWVTAPTWSESGTLGSADQPTYQPTGHSDM